MARIAKATKMTKPADTGRKAGRAAAVAAKSSAKATSPAVAPKRAAVPAPVPAGRKTGRASIVAPALKAPAGATKPVAVAKRTTGAPAPAAKTSKGELRAQVEKLEQTILALRAKSREANRAAKTAAARIAELEDQVAQFEKAAASQPAPAKRGPKPASPVRTRSSDRTIDPGDAVPPGVAVQEPALMDEEAETALENLEEHLGNH